LDRTRKASSLSFVTRLALTLAGVALFVVLALAAVSGRGGLGGCCHAGRSWAAFVLPAYPWAGALILALPGLRLDLLLGLILSLVPFASLAATARYLDEPGAWAAAYPIIEALGPLGVSALGFGFTALSALGVLLAVRRFQRPSQDQLDGYGVERSGEERSAQGDEERDGARSLGFAPRGSAVLPEEEPFDHEPRELDLSLPDLPPAPFLRSLQAPALSAEEPPLMDDSREADGEAARLEALESERMGDPEPEDAALKGDEPSDEPTELESLDDEPIPLMFGRTSAAPRSEGTPEVEMLEPSPRTQGSLNEVKTFSEGPLSEETLSEGPLEELDPALETGFWSDDDEGGAEPELDGDKVPLKADLGKDDSGARRPSLLPKVEVFHDGEHDEAVRDSGDARPAFDPAAVTPAAVLIKAGAPIQALPEAKPRLPGRKPVVAYSLPTEGILTSYPDGQYWIIDDKTRKAGEVLKETLSEFGIEAEVTGIRKGPVITMFEILPAPGVRLSKIANLSDNIALRLAASSVRIVAPIPGKHAVGIEVPNERRAIVSFKEIVENDSFRNAKMEVPVVLGKDITGDVQVVELTQTPHLLIAGATGSGKSVCVNAIILSILYRRSFNEVKLILIDPKIVELKLYNGIPHLLTPVITEPKRAFQALQYCLCEMERRYSLLDAMGVRDIKSYNKKIVEKRMATDRLPYIVVIIDEFADLMATTGKELESTLARLAAMSRAVGIHLVLATQRPSIDVITGLIKANIPSRIAFMVAGKFDSRIIIDAVGAEKLLGRGDMLYSSATDAFPVRMQGAFVSDDEVERVVAHVKTLGEPDYIDEEIFVDDEDDEGPSLFDEEDDDPLYEKALEIVLSQGKASASYLQRKLKIGYNRAARLVELMEEKGIVGKAQGSKPRDLMHNPDMGRAPNPRARYVPDLSPDDESSAGAEDGTTDEVEPADE